ncbi:MAG TPA: hypothetical protein VGD30_09280 [Telluria sp.]
MKLTTFLLILGTACGAASAQDAPPQAAAPAVAEREALPLKPDPSKLNKPLVKRRAVQQRIERMPTPAPIVTEGYRPILTVRPPSVYGQPTPALPPPAAPAQVNSCDGGGCTDTNGSRYTGGVGNTVLDQNGRNCTRTGTIIQCF